MNPFLWGLGSAVGWGTADFVARISGRALGPANSLLATATIGTVGMGLWLVFRETPIVWDPSGLHWLILIGFCLSTGMLLLYASLARGPVSIAAPLISSTPAFVVPGALLLGVVPSVTQLMAMAGVMLGTLIVARTAHPHSGMREGESGVRMTVVTGLSAAFFFAAALLIAREAVPIYGVLQVAWSGRGISLIFVIAFMMVTQTQVNVPMRWWPALFAQGVLDAGGLMFLYVGSVGDGAPLASIGSAPLAIVAVLLARIFLHERIPLIQWGGITLVAASGAFLAANS
jgi:drug/metabolite transporter (DMT)-like permease